MGFSAVLLLLQDFMKLTANKSPKRPIKAAVNSKKTISQPLKARKENMNEIFHRVSVRKFEQKPAEHHSQEDRFDDDRVLLI